MRISSKLQHLLFSVMAHDTSSIFSFFFTILFFPCGKVGSHYRALRVEHLSEFFKTWNFPNVPKGSCNGQFWTGCVLMTIKTTVVLKVIDFFLAESSWGKMIWMIQPGLFWQSIWLWLCWQVLLRSYFCQWAFWIMGNILLIYNWLISLVM